MIREKQSVRKKMKEDNTYFYHFLKPISKELAYVILCTKKYTRFI